MQNLFFWGYEKGKCEKLFNVSPIKGFFLVLLFDKRKSCPLFPTFRVVKKGAKFHFTILNSILTFMNGIFVLMIGVKIEYYFNNLIFFIKKI